MGDPSWAVHGYDLFFLQCLMHANLLVFVAALGELRVISDRTNETSKLHVGIAIVSGTSVLVYSMYFISFLLFYAFAAARSVLSSLSSLLS